MRVVVDDQVCDEPCGKVGEAIALGDAAARKRGRRVIEVHVDGERWTDAEMNEPSRMSATASEVRILSADPHVMARETFFECRDALAEIDRLQREAAERVESGQMPAAMEALGPAVALWQMIRQAVSDGARFASIELDAVRTPEGSLVEGMKVLNEHLARMADSLRRRDVVLLSDTLLYEMPRVIAQWRNLLQALAASAAE